MKLIYTSANSLLVNHIRNLLEAAGIDSRIKNEILAGGAGELPPTEAWPEVWVVEKDFARAQEVVDALERPESLPAWHCPVCGEQVEGQFGVCWNCGAPRPD